MIEDFKRGWSAFYIGTRMAWNDVSGDDKEFAVWREYNSQLRQILPGSTGAHSGFTADLAEAFGGMAPQLIAAGVSGGVGLASTTARAALLSGGTALSGTTLGLMGASTYGHALAEALDRADQLEQQARLVEAETPEGASQLREEARSLRERYRAIAGSKTVTQMLIERALPEELLWLGGKGAQGTFGRNLLNNVTKSSVEGFAGEAADQVINAGVYGDELNVPQMLQGAAMEAIAGSPFTVPGSIPRSPPPTPALQPQTSSLNSTADTVAAVNSTTPSRTNEEEITIASDVLTFVEQGSQLSDLSKAAGDTSPTVYSTTQPPGETIAASTSASRFPVQDKMKLAELGYPAEGVEKYVSENYDPDKYKELGGPDTVWLVMPSTSGQNIIPQAFADRLSMDHGGTVINRGISLFQLQQAKTKRGYIAKMESPAKLSLDDSDLISNLNGKRVVIVDDIMTSGMTTEALTETLSSHGVKVEAVAVLAAVKGGSVANSSQLTELAKIIATGTGKTLKEVQKEVNLVHQNSRGKLVVEAIREAREHPYEIYRIITRKANTLRETLRSGT